MATILIVDDEELVAHVVELSLRNQGHDVLAARTGAEATNIAEHRREPIDLVIANYALRDAKGVEVVRQLVRSHPEIKVLRISGRPLDMLQQDGDIAKDTPFLRKPFTPARLVETVDRVLQLHGENRAMARGASGRSEPADSSDRSASGKPGSPSGSHS